MAGSAMPTTVASSAATPDPSTVPAITQRPVPLAYVRPLAALVTARRATALPGPPQSPSIAGIGQRCVACALDPDDRPAAQVLEDVAAKPSCLPAIEHHPGQRPGEQRAEREGGTADAGREAAPQLPGERRSRDDQEAARHHED